MKHSIRGLRAACLVLCLAFPAGAAPAADPSLDYGDGLDWYHYTAGKGDAEAQYRLGRFYETGIKTAPRPAEARRWYAKAAEQGDARAQFRLAALLHQGRGGPKDLTGARRWYEAAAAQGRPEAIHNLAILLERQDPKRAAGLYEKAAKAGIAEASSQLAIMILEGRGRSPDKVAALAWLTLAAEGGAQGAKTALDLLATQLSPTERRQAQSQARNFAGQ